MSRQPLRGGRSGGDGDARAGHGRDRAAGAWTRSAIGLLTRLLDTQGDALERAAALCADAIAGDGLVHVFGTGHSRMAVEEMFPRYGSYPGFHPLVELSTTFHTQVVGTNGQRQAMFIERTEGLAEVILANFTLRPPDVMLVISSSGVTANPIEMAQGARGAGCRWSRSRRSNSPGPPAARTRPAPGCSDHADVVVDLGTVVGDAMVTIDGLDTPVGPGSSVVGVAVVNEIKVRTAQRLVARGAMPPVLTSATVVGDERVGAAVRRRVRRARATADPGAPACGSPTQDRSGREPGHERGESA